MRCALLLMAFLFAASPAAAQEEAVRTIPFDGMEIFCHILNYEKLTAVASIQELKKDARQSMLILFGDPRQWPKKGLATNELAPFLKAGGNLLVATDRRLFMPGIPVTITGEAAPEISAPQAYRGELSCPLLERDSDFAGEHPIFSFLRQGLATNCPSRLNVVHPFGGGPPNAPIIPLVDYVKPRFNEETGKEEFVRTGRAVAGSPKNAPPEGRALFIAGHGLFMNGMMMQSDNDNFAFAINVVRWLREGPNGTKRTKAMLIVDGEVITNFDVNLTPPPLPPVPPLKAIDRLLHGLEQERFFHRIVDRLIGENRDALLSFLFAAVTFLLLLYGAKKLMEGRYLLETAAPRMVGAAALGPAVPVVKQRQGVLFRQANLGNEARLLTRAWFRQEFGIEPERWSLDAPMAFQFKGWFWGRWWVQQADRVLRLASGADVAPMTRREFARVLRVLPRLGDARRTGRLALLAAGKTVRLSEPATLPLPSPLSPLP